MILFSIVPFSGVVRVGAVNCAEDNWLCQRQGIRGLIGLKINFSALLNHYFFSNIVIAILDFSLLLSI